MEDDLVRRPYSCRFASRRRGRLDDAYDTLRRLPLWKEYTLTKVEAEADGRVECDPDIKSIKSKLYVRHDTTRVSVDTDTCTSDDEDDCATSTTTGTYTCMAGTSCAGDWTSGLELRLELNDDSWDADSFPDYCSIQGDDDEIARCYYEAEPPIYVPPTFPPATAATPSS